MAEYIEREALLDSICYETCGIAFCGATNCAFMAKVGSAPVADVAPVVRCKNCKHRGWVQEPCHGKSVDYCRIWDCTLRNLEATFCSYGEQKDGGASNA